MHTPSTEFELSPRDHLERAIAALQQGQESKARKHVLAIQRLNPGDSVAKSLLMQIDDPPVSYFGRKFFNYKTRSGDSLSDISLKFLNDRFMFYGLAKYNRINDPRKLRVGQVLRIPGNRPPRVVAENRGNHFYRKAKSYFDQGRYPDVIALLDSRDARKYRDEQSTDLLVVAYSEQAKVYLEKADLIKAETVLEEAIRIQPNNKKINASLKKIRAKLNVGKIWEKADQEIQSGNLTQAYIHLRQVLDLDPHHELAKKQFTKIRPLVIDTAYRECMMAYKRHEFEEAVNLCGKVLSIEPDHELAKLHKARAEEILDKLKTMGNNSRSQVD